MSKAVRAQGARKCGPRDAQGYSFEGFHVLMLPSFMKGGDIFLLYLCFSNVAWVMCRSQTCLQRCGVFFSQTPNEAKASAAMTSTISNWQLTRQNPRKPRASRAQVARKHEKPQQDIYSHAVLDALSGAVQAMHRQPQHALSFFQAVSKRVAEPAVLSVGSRVLPDLPGATSAGRVFVGCYVNDEHTA